MNAEIQIAPELVTSPSAPSTAVRLAQASDRVAWDSYVSSHDEATGYHRWAWRSVFERGLGHPCFYLSAWAGDRIVGVLPVVKVKSVLFGRALSSLPYVNYGGVLADSPAIATQLMKAAEKLAHDEGLDHVVLRHRRQVFPDLPARTHKVTMVAPMETSATAMWEALDKKVRNQVRKAEKSGLTIVTGGEELLDDFYRIFARNMRDLGTPVYGRELFLEIVRAEPVDARLHVVYLANEAIAGALSYEYGDTLEVPSASSLREHRPLCPNHLLYWTMIQQAIANGRRRFDFGRSSPGDGTFQFKEQWGGQPEPLFWEYRLLGDAALPTDDRQSDKYQRKIEAWKKLPLPIARMLGPRIARCVP